MINNEKEAKNTINEETQKPKDQEEVVSSKEVLEKEANQNDLPEQQEENTLSEETTEELDLKDSNFGKLTKGKKVNPEDYSPEKWNPFQQKKSRFASKKDTTFETRLLQVKRVIKVTKGGRRFKFFALVVVGDKNGRVGYASSKDIEIPNAISKAERLAKKNLYRIKLVGDNKTVAHEFLAKHGSAKVLLKPAREGKGIIASNNIRAVVELAGYHNIYSKNLGTSNPKNVVIATIKALTAMKTKEELLALRDKNT